MKTEKEISFWARALLLKVENNPEKFSSFIENLEKSLGKKNYLIPAIFKKFEKMYKKEQNVKLIVAREINEETKEKLIGKIKKIFGEQKKVEIVLNKKLIGGFQIKTKNVLVKASLRDFLNKTKNKVYGNT